jgi:membrane fusion protein (multidrug efflux system)
MPTQDTENPAPSRRKTALRRILLYVVPALVIVGALAVYLSGGRYVETDNAYVKASKVTISSQVSGPIATVAVAENTPVAKGDVLFRLDRAPFEVALARADARLEQVSSDIEALKLSYRQKQAELQLAQINQDYADKDLKRQSQLIEQKIVAQSKFDDAKRAADVAHQQVMVLKQDLAQIQAKLSGNVDIPVEQHPDYLEARANRDQAALDLTNTVITAPFSGIASKVPEPGQYAESGKPIMSVVADADVWVEANFKETELTNVRPGQPVTIDVDTYPDRVWHGTVKSIAQATGAEFSVLPAQNSSGNWVKVVQRIPVRVQIEPQADDPPLRAGMSTTVEIDTGSRGRVMPKFMVSALSAVGVSNPASADPVRK